MLTLREWFWRLILRIRRSDFDRQTETEMRFHLELEIEAGMRRGLTRKQAEREARLRVGSIPGAMENVRKQRGLGWLDGTMMDLRHSWSALRRKPGFLLVAGGALASAVAVNTLIFTIVYGVILRPLPYASPERLVRVFESTRRNPKWPISIFNYMEDKRQSKLLENIALYTREDVQLMHGDRPERLTAVRITHDFLPTLGIAPALGRNFLPSEMHKGIRVVMISNTLWRNRFHADPAIAGQTIRLNRENWTIVGVLPASFQHVGGAYRSPLQGDTVALWWPLPLDLEGNALRSWHFTNAVARMKPGVSPKAAEEELNRILDDLTRRFPDDYTNARAQVEPLSSEVVGKSRFIVGVIVAGGFIVLLVACVNIAGLCIARVLARTRELSIRQALGGSSWRLIRAVLSENIIIGTAGGMLGLALAAALLPVLRVVLPSDFPRLHDIGFNWYAAAFALTSAFFTSLIAGLLPALRQAGLRPSAGSAQRLSSLRGGLVAAEVALSCVLCFGAVLLVRSSSLLSERDQGFSSTALTFQLALPENQYGKPARISAFTAELANRLQRIPGVKAAGLTTNIPWTGYNENTGFGILGRARRPGESRQARYQAADPGLFRALGFRLIRGRWIEYGDQANTPLVIVVNEALSRRYFETEDPIGKVLDLWGEKRRIVGVVADIRDHPADAAAEPAFWYPLAQVPFNALTAVLSTSGDALSLVTGARGAVESLDRELPLAEVRTMNEIAAQALAERRFGLWLCETFAALAIVLAAIGLYGMLSYTVEQRRREIGIRLALGANRREVIWTIVSRGFVLAGFGVIVGLMAAPLVGRAVSSMLYGVTASDPLTMVLAPVIILLATCAGSFAPGWRAARMEPMSALREQ